MSIDPDEILRQAHELSREEQLSLAYRIMSQAYRTGSSNPTSITELKGLGKELWRGTNPDEYVAKERDSWQQ